MRYLLGGNAEARSLVEFTPGDCVLARHMVTSMISVVADSFALEPADAPNRFVVGKTTYRFKTRAMAYLEKANVKTASGLVVCRHILIVAAIKRPGPVTEQLQHVNATELEDALKHSKRPRRSFVNVLPAVAPDQMILGWRNRPTMGWIFAARDIPELLAAFRGRKIKSVS